MMFYYTTCSTWKLHSLCTHMPRTSNASSIEIFLLIILQCSRLKFNFRGAGVCLVDCDALSTFPGLTLVCADVVESRIRPDLQQSKNAAFTTVVHDRVCRQKLCRSCSTGSGSSKGEELKYPNLISPSPLLPTAVFHCAHLCRGRARGRNRHFKTFWF